MLTVAHQAPTMAAARPITTNAAINPERTGSRHDCRCMPRRLGVIVAAALRGKCSVIPSEEGISVSLSGPLRTQADRANSRTRAPRAGTISPGQHLHQDGEGRALAAMPHAVPVTADQQDRRWALAYVVKIVTLVLAFYGPTTEAASTLLLGRGWDWGEALTRSLIFGVSWGLVFAIGTLVVARRTNRQTARRALDWSVTAGALPPDAARDEWEPRLRDELTRLKVARWMLPLCITLEAVLLAAVAVTTDEGTWGLWLAAGTAAVTSAALWAWAARRLHLVERLRAELPQL